MHVHLNKRHVRDLAPFSKEYKLFTSQHMRITIVELVHRRPFTDYVYGIYFSILSWEEQVPSLVDGKGRYLALVSDFVY